MSNPLVSITIPAFNREKYIAECIRSTLAQTYSTIEIIVVDDGSTDRTVEIAQTFTSDPRVRIYKNEKNSGIAKTRNRCVQLARGTYIAPLDSDDIWLDVNKLKSQVEFLESNPGYALVGGGIMFIDTDSKPIRKMLFPIYDSIIRNIILQYNPFPHSTTLIRRDAILAVGGYTEEYKTCEDYDLWFKLGTKYKFTNIPKVLAGYRIHGGNITRHTRLTSAATVLDLVKKYSSHYKRAYVGITKAYLRLLVAYIRT